jgi:hypothetical protein
MITNFIVFLLLQVVFIFSFVGQSVVSINSSQPMQLCDHEEADTRMCIHVQDALEKGAKTILVRTVDTDVIVILVGILPQLLILHPGADIWVAFGMGKHFQYYNINTICQNLGDPKNRALPVFYALTGSATTSQFYGKGKKSAWEAWKSYPEVTAAFLFVTVNPFEPLELDSPTFQQLERFTCVIYDKTSQVGSVNDLRQELFSKRTTSMDSIPPTQVRTGSKRNNF